MYPYGIHSGCFFYVGKSPYALAKLMYPKDFINLLGLEEIAPNDIILTPKLLKKSDSSD